MQCASVYICYLVLAREDRHIITRSLRQNDEAQALNVKVQEAVSMAAKERDEVEALREATGENSPSVHLLTANVISPSLHRSRHSARRRRRRRRSLKLWCKR
jgi:hypothetical protein